MKRILIFASLFILLLLILYLTKKDTIDQNESSPAPTQDQEVKNIPSTTSPSISFQGEIKDSHEHHEKQEDELKTPDEILNSKWYPSIEEKLLAFQDETTKVYLEKDNSPYQLKKEEEVFIVTYEKESGLRSSFRALINKNKKEIIRTWDQPHIEGEQPIETTPTGSL